jgi:hypothetical protein
MNKKENAEHLHEQAKHYNWDNGMEGLYQIILDDNCDKATALMIFWMGRPEWDLQFENREDVDSFRLDEYDFLEYLQEEYLTGKFDDKQQLSFNPKDDDGYDWTNQYPDLAKKFKRKIPDVMYQSIG